MIELLKKALNSKTKNSIFEKFESSRYKSVASMLNDMCQKRSNYKHRDDDKENKNDENKSDNC